MPSRTHTGREYNVVKEEKPKEDLKVMMVANLLLYGSEAGFFNQYFRDYYMSKFFKVLSSSLPFSFSMLNV